MTNEDKRTYPRLRVDKEYSRREMKKMTVRLRPDIAEVFKKKCEVEGTSAQMVLESYIKQYIEESE